MRITKDESAQVMISDLRMAGWHYPVLDGCYYCNFVPTSTQAVASQPTSEQLKSNRKYLQSLCGLKEGREGTELIMNEERTLSVTSL